MDIFESRGARELDLICGWDIMDCLEFGSAEASMMVRSNNCSDDLPGVEEVKNFFEEEKKQFGEMVARI